MSSIGVLCGRLSPRVRVAEWCCS